MRLDYTKLSPDGVKGIYALQNYVQRHSGLEENLLHLIELRASQINGCAFCIHLHALQLRALGETDIRVDCVGVWKETDLFTEREKAALAWTETVTLVSETHVPDEAFAAVGQHLSEKEISDLTLAISLINVWNRLAISFRQDPGTAEDLVAQRATREPVHA